MPRTVALPPTATEPTMWRKLLAAAHPDKGGDHDLFIWTSNLREVVCEGQTPPTRPEAGGGADRIPYDASLGFVDEFVTLTVRALSVGQHAEEPYASMLLLLIDCPADDHGRAVAKQERRASYKQLAYAAHHVGMNKHARVRWYELARSIPLSEKHISHIIGRLDERKAA